MRKVIISLAALLLLVSCGSARYSSSGFKPIDVREFAFIQPCACIDKNWIDGTFYDQPETDKAAQTVADVVNAERFPFSEMIRADYYEDGVNADILQWAKTLPGIKAKNSGRLRIPKSLMTMLDGTQDRYAVFIYSYGYVTTVDAYQKEKREKAISHAVDIVAENLTGVKGLTNPSQNYTPKNPYGNEMVCVVIDKQEECVVSYRKQTAFFPSHPTDYEDVSKMLHKLLKDYIR